MRHRFQHALRCCASIGLHLLPVGLLMLAFVLFSSPALAASAQDSNATLTTQTSIPASTRQLLSAFTPLAQTPPTCPSGQSANECAKTLTNSFNGTAQAIYQVGVWVVIVVGVLVIIWTTPAAIAAAATNNSRIIGQVVTRIGLIIGLILLAINSWTILQWFLGTAGQTISSPSLPNIGG